MRALLLLPLLLVACAPDADEPDPDSETASGADSPDVSFSDEALPGDEQLVITTREGDLDLGLTDEVLFFRLSPKKVDEIEDEIDAEVGDTDGLGRSIAEAVTGVVTDALRHAVHFPIEDVEAVRYEDGRLDITFVGEGEMPTVERDGEPIEEAFAPEDAERFAETFEALKAGRR